MSLYEYGGQCSVLLTVVSPRKIGEKDYAANEPYTLLQDVNVVLGYEDITTEQNAARPLLATRLGRPNQVGISKLPFTQKVWDLMFSNGGKKTLGTAWELHTVGENGKIYTKNRIESGDIFVYKDEKPLTSTRTGDFELTVDAEQQAKVLVFYPYVVSGTSYGFEIPHFGYFDLQISAMGNKDKITSTAFLHFPTVSLVSVPTLNLNNGGDIFNSILLFDVIYRGSEAPTITL